MGKALDLVRGDTAYILIGPLEKQATATTWAVPDFTGATPRLVIRDVTTRGLLYARAGSFTANGGDVVAGIGAFSQLAADFAGSGADAEAEVEVTYASGLVETFPKGPAKHPVLITDDLD